MIFPIIKQLSGPTDPAIKSNPILGFSLAAGNLFYKGLGIPVALGTVFGILLVEGFVITTLDAAVRLNRYLFEELWAILFKNPPRIMQHYWFNSFLAVVLMCILAYTNAFSALWPIFGAANQLLAALSLLAVSSWLLIRGKKNFFTVIPAVFMMATTVASLLILLRNYVQKGNYILIFTDLVLLCLSLGVIVLSFKIFSKTALPADAL